MGTLGGFPNPPVLAPRGEAALRSGRGTSLRWSLRAAKPRCARGERRTSLRSLRAAKPRYARAAGLAFGGRDAGGLVVARGRRRPDPPALEQWRVRRGRGP